MDECGFRLGCVAGRARVVIIKTGRAKKTVSLAYTELFLPSF